MIEGFHIEVLLALTYVLFLMAVAFVLERLAHRSQKESGGLPQLGIHLIELQNS